MGVSLGRKNLQMERKAHYGSAKSKSERVMVIGLSGIVSAAGRGMRGRQGPRKIANPICTRT